MSKHTVKVKYLSEKESKVLEIVDRFYPSSKTCFDCKAVNKNLALSERSWKCKECGSFHDRDEDPANNIEFEGARALVPGLGNLRHSSMSAIAGKSLRIPSSLDLGVCQYIFLDLL